MSSILKPSEIVERSKQRRIIEKYKKDFLEIVQKKRGSLNDFIIDEAIDIPEDFYVLSWNILHHEYKREKGYVTRTIRQFLFHSLKVGNQYYIRVYYTKPTLPRLYICDIPINDSKIYTHFRRWLSTIPIKHTCSKQLTENDKILLNQTINKLRADIIKELRPSEKQLETINQHLDELSEKVEKLDKIDWITLGISIATAITIALSLDTAKGKKLYELFKKAFLKPQKTDTDKPPKKAKKRKKNNTDKNRGGNIPVAS